MLTEFQYNSVWQGMLAAETRAFYFADLARQHTLRKQWITGISFFLSSGAAATIVGKLPSWMPILASIMVAVLNAYSILISLDRRMSVMAELHSAWSRIADEYRMLWSHTHEEGAEQTFNSIVEKERRPSELAVRDAPNDQALLGKWQQRVFVLHDLKTT